jgi:hypothetical protein
MYTSNSASETKLNDTKILVPLSLSMKVGFNPLDSAVKNFQNISLYDIVKKNTDTQFLAGGTKYCYRLSYDNLMLTALGARDNHGDLINQKYADSYVKQQMHSISGEQGDLCMYTYSPQELQEFLQLNINKHYTFLPLTVHSTESANGIRHDMLLIFDNYTKLFYWFDGKNREDYLPIGQNLPKNAMDVLLINLDLSYHWDILMNRLHHGRSKVPCIHMDQLDSSILFYQPHGVII